MKNSDFWKSMTTPIILEPKENESFKSIKNLFDEYIRLNVCIRCPVSGTVHNMPYRRSISSAMARSLKELYKLSKYEHDPKSIYPSSVGDFTKLRYWNLIKQSDSSGFWCITSEGIAFVENVITVPKYAIIINNEVKTHMGDHIFFNDIA